MKKYNRKIYIPVIFGLTILFGSLSLINGWFILGVITSMVAFIHVHNRADNIDHYCLGVDLDTNKEGDVLEISIYAFDKLKNRYFPIMSHFKQLRIYVDVILLDNFYSNIGYSIVEKPEFGIRQVTDSTKTDIVEVKQFYKQMIRSVNSNYSLSCGSMMAINIQQPSFSNKAPGVAGKLWNWWTFKRN